MKFLEELDDYIDCASDEINTTNANGKMISRLLMSVSQNEIERTKIVLSGAIKMVIYLDKLHLDLKEIVRNSCLIL